MVNPDYGSAALACPEKSGQNRPVNDSVVPTSVHSAVSPSCHPGRFHSEWSATRCDPKARPRSSAHRVAASGGSQCGLGNADVILRARGAGHEPTEGGPNAVDVESLGVAQPRRGSARGSWAIDRSWRKESGLGACRKLRSARPSRCNPGCAPEKGVGEERPRTKLVISLMRSLVEQQGASGGRKQCVSNEEF